ncbi:cysteine--tRNA ligase [Lichenicoccus sp.]|uniref:cysteine--tRNA ligase n=1 Tax=Lichenicoccus sp. TaxID=2781899 RepID=UPI003D1355AB
MPQLVPPRLVLHDSLTRGEVPFVPLDPAHVRIYYCGPTVYDLAHVGNLRAMVAADILVRLLRRLYPRVTYVRNITDVDDKINARARECGIPIEALTVRTTADFHADLAAIGNLPPDHEPRATEHVRQMVALIERLIVSGHAYEADGHVLFSVASFADYGRLSGRDPEELLAGARVEVAPYKREAGDFVLWKPSTPELPGWDSPWGRGRPGWHIECSAMAHEYLGGSFDIHGGGTDLLFPHHENERAQSLCGYPGGQFARIWLHNAMLLVDGEKMSKSLGNFYTVREILAEAPAEALRLLLLGTHYRSVLNFTRSGLVEARRTLDRFYRALERHDGAVAAPDAVPEAFLDALCDDLNTPLAIALLHRLADAALAGDAGAAAGLRAAGGLIGLLGAAPQAWFRQGGSQDADAAIEALIAERIAARTGRDFARADAIRGELAGQGIVLEDNASGTTWRRA